MPKGSLPRGGKKTIRLTANADGSQQYVRGKTPMVCVMIVNKLVQTVVNAVEKAFRKGSVKTSARLTKGASMLERAEQVEARKELARRAKKK